MNWGNTNTNGAKYVAHLDKLTRKLTAFGSFAELVNAGGDYRPTLVVSDDATQLANAYNFEQRRRGTGKCVEFRPAVVTPVDTIKSLRAEGVSIRKTECGEYRVAFIGKSERYAAYATDRADAIATGRAMLTQLTSNGGTFADLKDDLRIGGGK